MLRGTNWSKIPINRETRSYQRNSFQLPTVPIGVKSPIERKSVVDSSEMISTCLQSAIFISIRETSVHELCKKKKSLASFRSALTRLARVPACIHCTIIR